MQVFSGSLQMRWREVLWTSYYSFDSWRYQPGFKKDDFGQNPINYKNGLTWSDLELRSSITKVNFRRMADLYSNFTAEGYNIESLRKIIQLAKDRNIKLLIVNMPIITDDKYLIDTSYEPMMTKNHINLVDASDDALSRVISETNVPFLNLRHSKEFLVTDFADPLHLTSHGAIKLSNLVASKVIQIEK